MSDWKCSKCGAETEGTCAATGQGPEPLAAPPYNNDYGRRIQSQTCTPTWEAWKKQEIMVINEYRLNLLDREHRTQLREAMHQFLNLQP